VTHLTLTSNTAHNRVLVFILNWMKPQSLTHKCVMWAKNYIVVCKKEEERHVLNMACCGVYICLKPFDHSWIFAPKFQPICCSWIQPRLL
jgi:hypothetical protein